MIGFFLTLVCRSASKENLNNNTPYLWSGGMVRRGRSATNSVNSPDGSADKPSGGYGGIVFVLTILTFYLFSELKKRQMEDNRLNMLELDMSLLFNSAPCGYHYLDEKGIVLNINDTLLRWLEYEREEVVGRMKFSDLVAEAPEMLRERMGTMGKARGAKVEVDLLKKSGEKLPVILAMVDSDEISLHSSGQLYSSIDNSKCHEALERIQTLDRELEAFSYSISHDLRAPLRSIDGYSKILQEDYASALDDEGRRVLNVVTNNARRMGKLIDDLLDFGRLGRKSIQQTQVNMTVVVKSIVQELLLQEPARTIDVTVSELLPAPGDADMIRQVWFNLLENAVKYTGKREVATIEIRSYTNDDREVCYEVKDNGVGFDMQYAHKLFGIFQRLHKMQDFSGTGVGLAIVQRIISRHGGRVWAEALLNQGATFSFTLPIEHENK